MQWTPEVGRHRILEIFVPHMLERADVRAAVDAVLDRWRAIDVLINNAGIIQVGPLEHMEPEDFENAMATHFWGPLHLMFEIVPVMRRRGFGRIVNISSIGGKIAVPHLAPYCASKFALIGLSDAVRAELDPYGIRVTTVSPGPDAHRLAGQRVVQGTARGGVRVVRDRDSLPACRPSAPSAPRGRSSMRAATATRS